MTPEEVREQIAEVIPTVCVPCNDYEHRKECPAPCKEQYAVAAQILSIPGLCILAEQEELRGKVTQLTKALDEDATDLWRLSNAIRKEIKARGWIMEGRGGYAWDDDRYRDETRLAFEAILKLIENVQHPAQLRFHQVMNEVVQK